MSFEKILAQAGATPVAAAKIGGHLVKHTTAQASPPPTALTAQERTVSLG